MFQGLEHTSQGLERTSQGLERTSQGLEHKNQRLQKEKAQRKNTALIDCFNKNNQSSNGLRWLRRTSLPSKRQMASIHSCFNGMDS